MDNNQLALLIKLMNTVKEIEEECYADNDYGKLIENLAIFNCSLIQVEDRIMELLSDEEE